MYLSSNKVKVFPSAYRGNTLVDNVSKLYDPESRLFTEKNLSNFGNNIVDKDNGSYIISDSFTTPTSSTDSSLEFVIHGYRFNISLSVADLNSLLGSSTSLSVFAKIQLSAKNTSTDSTSYDALSLSNIAAPTNNTLDVSTEFQGLSLETSGSTVAGSGIYFLQLLDYANGAWTIHAASKLKLSTPYIQDGSTGKSIAEQIHTDTATITTANETTSNIDTANIVTSNITGNENVAGTLDVSKSTTLKDTLDVTKDTTIRGTLKAGDSTLGTISANTITPKLDNTSSLGYGGDSTGANQKRYKNVYAVTFTGVLDGTLKNSKTLWGHSFDASSNIDGGISNTKDITPDCTGAANIGSADLKYNYIYANYFSGTGATDTNLGNAGKINISCNGPTTLGFHIDTGDGVGSKDAFYVANGLTLDVDSNTLKHSNSIESGDTNPGAQTPEFGDTFNIPYVSYDTQGHITAKADSTTTIPATIASSTAPGLIKIGYTDTVTNSQNYPLQLSDDKAYTNVPWTDTHSKTAVGTGTYYLVGSNSNVDQTDDTLYKNANIWIGNANYYACLHVPTLYLSSGHADTILSSAITSTAHTSDNLVSAYSLYLSLPTINGSKPYTGNVYAPNNTGNKWEVCTSRGTTTPTPIFSKNDATFINWDIADFRYWETPGDDSTIKYVIAFSSDGDNSSFYSASYTTGTLFFGKPGASIKVSAVATRMGEVIHLGISLRLGQRTSILDGSKMRLDVMGWLWGNGLMSTQEIGYYGNYTARSQIMSANVSGVAMDGEDSKAGTYPHMITYWNHLGDTTHSTGTNTYGTNYGRYLYVGFNGTPEVDGLSIDVTILARND